MRHKRLRWKIIWALVRNRYTFGWVDRDVDRTLWLHTDPAIVVTIKIRKNLSRTDP